MGNTSSDTLQPSASPLEQLRNARARKNTDSTLFNLRLVWGFRLSIDFVILALGILGLLYPTESSSTDQSGDLSFILIFLGLESIFILAFFVKRSWCKIPLSIFSAISLLAFPVGTYLSLYHYFNIGKIQFKE